MNYFPEGLRFFNFLDMRLANKTYCTQSWGVSGVSGTAREKFRQFTGGNNKALFFKSAAENIVLVTRTLITRLTETFL